MSVAGRSSSEGSFYARAVAVALREAETPTGITPEALAGLDDGQKRALAMWQYGKAGFDDGRAFIPRRIRSMPIDGRLALALDRDLDLAFEARERLRVAASPVYFTSQYGSIEPEEGVSIPFDLWPEQVEALEVMAAELRVIVLKARQLGLTWLALHLAIWLMAFNPETPRIRVLVLSKIGSDADELIERARKLTERLPLFLRPRETWKFRDSNSRFVLNTGSQMRSLMGTVAAARSFTAGFAILDEFGFYRHQQAQGVWTAVNPTLGERGKACVISTGNGEAGDGAAFAKLWRSAKAEGTMVPVFLPDTANPERRAEGWRDRKRREFLTDEDFLAEHPLTEEDAFAGTGAFKVYPGSGIDAALALGARLEPLLPKLALEGIEWGIDWGDFQTFAVYGVALPGGGMFVFDEVVMAHTEPSKAAEQIIYRDAGGMPGARCVASFADAAPAGTNRTFAAVLREAANAAPDRYPRGHTTVPFSDYKEGGGHRKGVNTVAYVRALLDTSADFTGTPAEAHGLLAIGPRCETLAQQMRNLEREADTGKVRKPALDPRHVERGDHGADALVALMANRAARWRLETARSD